MMNKRELSKYYYITLEIRELEERITVVENTIIGSSKLTGMPRGSGKSDPVNKTTELLVNLKSKLEKRKADAMIKLIQIEDYISKIEDIEIRLIFSKRYVELKKWDTIAREMHMSIATVYRKHQKQLGMKCYEN